MATVKCKCGKAAIHFYNNKPRFRFQCGCCDCLQKLQWAANEAKKLNIVDDRKQGTFIPSLYYLESDVVSIDGEEHLKIFQLRERDRSSPFCVATCCYSVVAVDNMSYKNNVIMILADGCDQDNMVDIKPNAKIFMKDWEKVADKATDNNNNTTNDNEDSEIFTFYGDDRDSKETVGKLIEAADMQPIKGGIKGAFSMRQFFTKKGNPTILNLPEYKLIL